MNPKLSNPPITYILAQVKMSEILKIEDYIPQLQESIREDFPLFKLINTKVLGLDLSPPIVKAFSQWHFTNKMGTMGILIDSGSIILHTSLYESFHNILNIFESILEKFNRILKIALCIRVGLRYINLIQDFISQYLQPELLGFLPQKNKPQKYIVQTDSSQEIQLGTLKVKSVRISDKTLIPYHEKKLNNLFVSSDLWQSAEHLSFDHFQARIPEKDYLILDIDCFSEKQYDLDVRKITDLFKEFHTEIYETFCKAVTKDALEAWR